MPASIVCLQEEATTAGLEVLRRGGNAVDAAIAAGFAECVVAPSLVSIGGAASMHIYHGPSGQHKLIQGECPVGSRATPEVFADGYVGRRDLVGRWEVKGYINQMGYAAIAVPTFVRVMYGAHRLFGSMPWAELLKPAIRLAKDGFTFNAYTRRFWTEEGDFSVVPEAKPLVKLKLTDECASLFLTPPGELYPAGHRMVLPDLARTLTAIAEGGADAFYQGEIGRKMARDFEAHGGFVTYEDLVNYRPRFYDEPYQGRFRDLTIATKHLPSTNIEMIQYLQIVDGVDFAEYQHNSPEYLDLIARIMHQVFSDRAAYYADPIFHDVPVARLTSRERASELRARALDRTVRAGRTNGGSGSTHFCVLDREGTGVSCSHSVGSGSGVVTPGLGFIHNNFMGLFDPLPNTMNSIARGKCGVAGGGAHMLLRDGRVRLITGSPGGPRGTTGVLQSLLNRWGFGMNPEESVAAPRIHAEQPELMYVEYTFPASTLERLRQMGYQIVQWRYGGRVTTIEVDEEGTVGGVVDPRAAGTVGLLQ